MKQATRKRIGYWLERNRKYVMFLSIMVFIHALLMGDNLLNRAIATISVIILVLSVLPFEMMVDDVG